MGRPPKKKRMVPLRIMVSQFHALFVETQAERRKVSQGVIVREALDLAHEVWEEREDLDAIQNEKGGIS